jgi:hypothetical protein
MALVHTDLWLRRAEKDGIFNILSHKEVSQRHVKQCDRYNIHPIFDIVLAIMY